MITLEEAMKIIADEVKTLSFENIQLEHALYRTLAYPVYADSDYPPFNKAAMDGFACRREDLDKVLQITQEIPAGHVPALKNRNRGMCAHHDRCHDA